MRTSRSILGVLTVLVLLTVSIFYFANKPAPKNLDKKEEITGTLEAEETDVNVKVPGRISKIYVEEGQEVKEGDIIAEIEADNIKAKVKQAEAILSAAKSKYEQAKIASNAQKEQSDNMIKQAGSALDAATAQQRKVKGGARPQQIEQAKLTVDQAREGYTLTNSTYARLEKLAKDGLLPQQKLDAAKTELEVSKSKLSMAEEQYNLVKTGAQEEDIQAVNALVGQAQAAVSMANTTKLQISLREQDIEAAKSQVFQAQGALEEANSYLTDSKIKSPVEGIVTMRSVDNGEIASTGTPVVTISNLKQIWVNVKVRETSIRMFRVGDNINVKVPGMPGRPYSGKITFIAAKPSYATERATQEKGERDIVAFGVKIKMDNSDLMLKPGMTAVIDIEGN